MANTTIPIELSSTPGIVDNSNATAITIDSSENVGIGTASPTAYTGYATLALNGTNGGLLEFKKGDTQMSYIANGGDPQLQFVTNGAERMRITNAGNVGIGTSPSRRLHVNSGIEGISAGIAGTTYGIRFDNGGTYSSGMSTIHGVDNTLTGTYQPIMLNGSDVRFGTSTTERMRILSNGAIGMGFTSQISGATLSVYSSADGGVVIGSSGGTNAFRKIYHDPSSGILYFTSTGNAPYLSNAGGWTNASDIAIKKDIEDIDYGLETVKSLQPRKYKMKDTDEKQIGFVAQEIEKIVPEVVSGEDGKKGVSYGQITPILIKAIQEQQTIIESLKARITALES